MPRAAHSSAISHWLLSEYLESPLLALTLIQRCQPSVLSSARAGRSPAARTPARACHRSGGQSARQRAPPAYAASSSASSGPSPTGSSSSTRWRSARCCSRGGLGLVVGGVGALDGLLEPGQRRGDVRAGELLERLGRDVLVRAPAGDGHALAPRDDEAGGV